MLQRLFILSMSATPGHGGEVAFIPSPQNSLGTSVHKPPKHLTTCPTA